MCTKAYALGQDPLTDATARGSRSCFTGWLTRGPAVFYVYTHVRIEASPMDVVSVACSVSGSC